MYKFVMCKVRDMKAQIRQMAGEPKQLYILDYGQYEDMPGYWAELRNGDDGTVLSDGHFPTFDALVVYTYKMRQTYGKIGTLIDEPIVTKRRGVAE